MLVLFVFRCVVLCFKTYVVLRMQHKSVQKSEESKKSDFSEFFSEKPRKTVDKGLIKWYYRQAN